MKMSERTKKASSITKKLSVNGEKALEEYSGEAPGRLKRRRRRTMVKTKSQTLEGRERQTKEIPSQIGEIVVTISDDDDDDGMGEKAEVSVRNTNGAAVKTDAGVGKHRDREEEIIAPCTESLQDLIKKYMLTSKEEAELAMSHILSPDYTRELALVCSHTPYCLYLYSGVELMDGLKATVLLVGYYDQRSGAAVLKLLDARPSLSTTNRDALDSNRLIQILIHFGLSLYNLSVFYCDSPDRGANSEMEARLRAFRPGLVSLSSLPGLAGRACSDGLEAAFGTVGELTQHIHLHFSNCSLPAGAALREVAACSRHYQPSVPVAAQCLFISHMVRRMTNDWRGLLDYFESLGPSPEARRIRILMRRRNVRLGALFLCQALQPLCAFQEAQLSGSAGLAVQLQLMAALSQAYAARILKSSSVGPYLEQHDRGMLRDAGLLLPDLELKVSPRVSEYLLELLRSDGAPDDASWETFLGDVVAFTQAVLENIGASFPDELGFAAMQNMGLLLTPPRQGKALKSRGWLMRKLCSHLRLSTSRSPEYHNLTRDVVQEFDLHSDEEEDVIGAHQRERKERNWGKVLMTMQRSSLLHRLLQTLLALPHSLNRDMVFDQVFRSSVSAAPIPRRHSPEKRKHSGIDEEEEEEEEAAEADEEEVSEATDHSSDSGSGISEDFDLPSGPGPRTNRSHVPARVASCSMTGSPNTSSTASASPPMVYISIMDSDVEEVDMTSMLVNQTISEDITIETEAPPPEEDVGPWVGGLVWGPRPGHSLWPAIIKARGRASTAPRVCLVGWYGDEEQYSEVPFQSLQPGADFKQCYCDKTFATTSKYRTAVFRFLQEAARRCGKRFSPKDPKELLVLKLDWAFQWALPSGILMGSKSADAPNDETKTNQLKTKRRRPPLSSRPDESSASNSQDAAPTTPRRVKKRRWGQEKGEGSGGGSERRNDGLVDIPTYKPKTSHKIEEAAGDYVQPDQNDREAAIRSIKEQGLDIEAFCLCCGTTDIETPHPLFRGGLCQRCKDNFTETLFHYDEDGYQSYCTICCYGMEVIMCGNDSCCRSFCLNCLDILVDPGTFDSLKETDPWICYLCQPLAAHGALKPRKDWSVRVQEFFANNSDMEFEPHRVYPSIPANRRRPLRVLSLFDGIGTGYLVLKDLGFKVDKYFASEICEDSLAVTRINHETRITHVDDVRFITQEQLTKWGPFDLLIGGSPCNDLSIVNPYRKGIYEGSGRLFFEYYRILHLLKPREDDPRPFFWMFENVVWMNRHDKLNICRFLECNPVMADAVKVSPAHRARYFWGNIPGMNRPMTPSQKDKLNLQQCLETGREARFTKVKTITTQPNSLKQGKVPICPVVENGKDDNLWITEIETIFGFPKHYTDVRNMNRKERQKVLGKSWSVPVIRHLFAPLKDYFACEEMNSSSASSCPPDGSH
ncbi:unnamed protein product [Gadus morhua 'NCC']